MEKLTRKVKALSLGRLEEGSIGFITAEDEGKWYNVFGEKEILEEMTKSVVAKGNIIEFEFENNNVGSITLIEKAPEGSGFDDMTNFEDLLSAAHEKFKDDGFDIVTKMLEMDYEKKRALFKATVTVGVLGVVRVFTGHGDAEGISSDSIKPHFIRMAETRAIARALRWATNNAKVEEEETSGEEVPKTE